MSNIGFTPGRLNPKLFEIFEKQSQASSIEMVAGQFLREEDENSKESEELLKKLTDIARGKKENQEDNDDEKEPGFTGRRRYSGGKRHSGHKRYSGGKCNSGGRKYSGSKRHSRHKRYSGGKRHSGRKYSGKKRMW
jgi:hypothetical protein